MAESKKCIFSSGITESFEAGCNLDNWEKKMTQILVSKLLQLEVGKVGTIPNWDLRIIRLPNSVSQYSDSIIFFVQRNTQSEKVRVSVLFDNEYKSTSETFYEMLFKQNYPILKDALRELGANRILKILESNDREIMELEQKKSELEQKRIRLFS